MSDKNTTFQFDDDRWNLLRIRWTSFVGAVANIGYCFLYNWMNPTYYDPLWQRVLVSLLIAAVAVATFRKKSSLRALNLGFAVGIFALTVHIFFLVVKNQLAPIYVMGSFILFFSAGAAFASVTMLSIFYAFCFAVGVSIYVVYPGENSTILLMAVVVSAAISYSVFATMFNLVNKLRESKAAVESKTQALDNMMNSLGQGFLSFRADGICLPIFSRACVELLETEPGERPAIEVLKLDALQTQHFKTELAHAFGSKEAFARFVQKLPAQFPHAHGRHIALDYHASVDAAGRIEEIVVVATDRTDLVRAERSAETEKKHSMMVATIVKQKRFFRVFLDDLNRGLERYSRVGGPPVDPADFKRFLHSIKGGAGMFWMEDMAQLLHACEQEWANTDSVFLPSAVLARRQTALLRAAFEKFTAANADVLGNEFRTQRLAEFPLAEIQNIVRRTEFNSTPQPIQHDITQLALQPIARYFEPFSDLAIRLARAQRKRMEVIEFRGGDLAIFPEPYSELFSSFVHVFRNAIDHALELPADRVAAGKPEAGRLIVEFKRKGGAERGTLVFTVTDDGRGVDPARIREKLEKLGEPIPKTSEAELIQSIFSAGFSTMPTATELSGRGVGLDALKFAAESLGGQVRVDSELGVGTVFTIEVPEIDARVFLQDRTRGAA